MRTQIMIHGARPEVHRSAGHVWLTVPLGPAAGPSEPAPTVTLFFDTPGIAVDVALELGVQAEIATRLLALDRAPAASQEVPA